MIPQPNEIVGFWGADQLLRWPEHLLRARGFSEEDCDYLSKVGLPAADDWSWEIGDRVTSLPYLDEKRTLVTIAYDTTVVPICVDLSREGEVLCVEEPGKERFVNTSVRQFGACLYHYRRLAYFDRSGGQDEDARIAKAFHAEIAEIDPPAILDPERYWALIILQIHSGMM